MTQIDKGKLSVTDRRTDGQSGLQSRVHATKKENINGEYFGRKDGKAERNMKKKEGLKRGNASVITRPKLNEICQIHRQTSQEFFFPHFLSFLRHFDFLFHRFCFHGSLSRSVAQSLVSSVAQSLSRSVAQSLSRLVAQSLTYIQISMSTSLCLCQAICRRKGQSGLALVIHEHVRILKWARLGLFSLFSSRRSVDKFRQANSVLPNDASSGPPSY